MTSAAASWGSASIPIGLEIATTARSTPSAFRSWRAAAGGLGGGVDHVGQLAAAVQDGEAVRAADEGETVAPGEGVEERRGPDVLVEVDGHGPMKITNSISFIKITEAPPRGRLVVVPEALDRVSLPS